MPSKLGRSDNAMCDPESKQKIDWGSLPLDSILKIGQAVTSLGGDVAAMRLVCRQWRQGVDFVAVSLAPQGPPSWAAFPGIAAVDFDMRGQAHVLDDAALAELCGHVAGLRSLNLGGPFRLQDISPLTSLAALTCLVLHEATVTNEQLGPVLRALPGLQSLSLRGCVYLTFELLPSLEACRGLTRLDLADCALSLHLIMQESIAALSTLTRLHTLDLGGSNGVTDDVLGALAQLPNLRALGLRGAIGITDDGIAGLAAGVICRQLHVLDIQGCTALTDAVWEILARLSALQVLSMAHLPHLLRFPAMSEQGAAALWLWPRLRTLSLAGAAAHPAKVKLLAVTCGAALQELDLSAPEPQAGAGSLQGSHRGCYSRLPAHQLRDLVSASRHLKSLRALNLARTGLPAEAAVAFMRAAPRLERLDLSGCPAAAPRPCRPRSAGGRWWTSGVYIPGAEPVGAHPPHEGMELPAVGSGPSAADFAAALGALSSLRALKLDRCGDLTDEHLTHISSLSHLTELVLARNKGVGDGALASLADSAAQLRIVDLSATSVTDQGLAMLTKRPALLHHLHTLRLARCSPLVTGQGVASLAAASGACSWQHLDLADCSGMDNEALGTVAAQMSRLKTLRLTGCSAITPPGLCHLSRFSRLQQLDVSRCHGAVTDAALRELCGYLTQLTSLHLGGTTRLTSCSLPALAALPCLAKADLTCCSGLGATDDELAESLSLITSANVDLPQGSASPTGSPIKRRPRAISGPALPMDLD